MDSINRTGYWALFRNTVKLAAPAVFESLFNSTIFLVDALMVASLGPAPLAAAGMAGIVMWRLRAMAGCVQVGAGAMIARRWGGGETDRACELFSHVALLGLAAGLLCLLVWPLAGPLFAAMNAEGRVLAEAVAYFHVVLLVFPLRLASTSMASALRAAGDTRTPMVTTAIINFVNIGFNWVFIFGNLGAPALGLVGAGIATVIALAVEFAIYVWVGFRGVRLKRIFHRDQIEAPSIGEEIEPAPAILTPGRGASSSVTLFRFAPSGWRLIVPGATGSILRISHATFWEEVAITIGFLGFFGMIGSFGELSVAAHVAITRIESFSFNAGFGISIAAATLVGQALGGRSPGDARRAWGVCLMLGMGTMGLMGIVMCLAPEWFMYWFGSKENAGLSAIAIPLLILAAVEQPFIGATLVLANGLRGAGSTLAPLAAQMIGVTIIRLGLGYYLAFPLGMGMIGIYYATIADWVFRAAVLGLIVARGRWALKAV